MMGAKRSEEMKRALELILKKGMSQAEAARQTGVTKGAISQTMEIRERNAERKKSRENLDTQR